MKGEEPDYLLSVDETMHALKVGRVLLYKLVNSGQIPSFTIGTSRKIPRSSIDSYIKRKLAEAKKK